MSLTLAVRPLTARRAKIGVIGTYVPPRLLTNKDLEEMVETSDQWIYSRVGIRERHLVEKGMASSDMAVEAERRGLDSRRIVATDVEAIIVATVAPGILFPASACLVQNKLGAKSWSISKVLSWRFTKLLRRLTAKMWPNQWQPRLVGRRLVFRSLWMR
jgi:3-oxoacyl-[acyl-carrier-protein] synthase-3